MQRVVVINPKGGSGKSTLAIHLASYFAKSGLKTALMDYDSQGSSTFWLNKRPENLPAIQSIPAYKHVHGVTRSWFLRLEPNTERVVIDTPAGIDISQFKPTLNEASAILIPVLPSDIDIHAVSHCIADLLLTAKINRLEERIAVIANRVRHNTLIYKKLLLFLDSLSIPFIATLRDTQNYVHASEQGSSIFEMSGSRVIPDQESWQPVLEWIESRPEQNLVTRHA